MKVLFGMALRQTTVFVERLLRLIGLNWKVPDFSTLSRRQKTLAVDIPYRGSNGPLHLLIDSTDIKTEGEGEWNACKHGGPKRRAWRKIHLGIDENTLEVRAVEITGSHIGDAPVLPDLLNQIPEEEVIGSVTAVPMIHASATTPSLTTGRMLSFRLAKMPSRGRPSPRVRGPETRLYGRRNILAERSGETGADTTDEAVPKRNLSGSCCA
ncbi:Transposase DDE domain protein [Falsiruegeria litorea R37]|uniref:Transposase DDE domain protein n=1 Tax=Falsiruegeria litorea R37 TaxID=1200284 RepID=A0A1Y5RV69_9RHOB|nr:Transposase DDE domain protein [Falsiruegeria litorea R37]